VHNTGPRIALIQAEATFREIGFGNHVDRKAFARRVARANAHGAPLYSASDVPADLFVVDISELPGFAPAGSKPKAATIH
jgi:hypothetical protein